jgi:hypothetical protein
MTHHYGSNYFKGLQDDLIIINISPLNAYIYSRLWSLTRINGSTQDRNDDFPDRPTSSMPHSMMESMRDRYRDFSCIYFGVCYDIRMKPH